MALVLASAPHQEVEAEPETNETLRIYSPAPPSVMLHQFNLALGENLKACGIQNIVISLALPESINQFSDASVKKKKTELPIVTTIDFFPAIHQQGPSWHSYSKPNADLKFVASLYDVAFGVLAFDKDITTPEDLKGKRIGAPPRPSAVRVFTEALLRDGWGILEDVEIVDIYPPALADAVESGDIDATTWNLVTQADGALAVAVPGLLEVNNAAWVPVDADTVRAINDANTFQVDLTVIKSSPDEETALLSFRQALAAWEVTPDQTIDDILSCITSGESVSNNLYSELHEMANWPGLNGAHIHQAALAFYHKHGLAIVENNQ